MPCCCPTPEAGEGPGLDRRGFIRFALAGGAALLLDTTRRAHAGGSAEALVLSCMDYRLADDVHRFMDSLGMTGHYDHVVLAGASAGVVHPAFEHWHATFWDHLKVAIDLHHVHKVIVIDHRDCGAYKLALGPEHAADPEVEMGEHSRMIAALTARIRSRFEALEVEGYLMALDGSAERIAL